MRIICMNVIDVGKGVTRNKEDRVIISIFYIDPPARRTKACTQK